MPAFITALLSTGLAVTSTAGPAIATALASDPKIPDYAKTSKTALLTEAEMLPVLRQIEAAARLGLRLEDVPVGPIKKEKGKRRPTLEDVDFTGMSDAQIQQQYARDMAEAALAAQSRYGTQFVEEANRQRALADPEGVAARQALNQLIMEDIAKAKTAERPLAETLERQLLADLRSGSGLAPNEAAQVQRAVASRAGAGDYTSPAGIESSMTYGTEGLERLQGRQQKMLSYLTSGVTPEDVEYRRRQQGLANIGSFLRGQTPVAQFGQLSGAQQGASPMVAGPNLPGLTGQTAGAIQNQYARNYGYNVENRLNTTSDWFAGLNTALQGAGALGQAGWKPLA